MFKQRVFNYFVSSLLFSAFANAGCTIRFKYPV